MKRILFLLLCVLIVYSGYAQNPDGKDEMILLKPEQKSKSDSSKIKIIRDSIYIFQSKPVSELFMIGKNSYKKGNKKSNGQSRPFKGHWSGFNYGFVTFTKLSDTWKDIELDWSHSFAMQFNFLKYSINLSARNNFGLVTGMGFEYQRLRFNKNDISLIKADGDLTIIHPTDIYPEIASIKRSCFKNLYLTIPILFEVQFPACSRKRAYVSGGIMGGLRLHSKTKIVYDDKDGDKHRKKNKGDFNVTPFKADFIAKIGYRSLNFWGSYTLNHMFKAHKAPKAHPYTIGIGLSF